jgi:thiol-disulfide isomerase/thioredoxin/outer membrane lipoprotein-sorting protein
MKTKILFLFTVILLVSCSNSDKDILNKISSNLNNIKTLKYLSVVEQKDNGQIVYQSKDTISFDFTNGLKYHFSSEKGELIYNGKKILLSINQEKIITTNDDNRPESVNNALFNTLNPLKKILPKLIKDESITKLRKKDTVFNGRDYFNFSFLLKKKYIDLISYEIKEGIDYDSEYSLIVDKTNYLPYKIISPNGKEGIVSTTIENLELNIEFNNKLWEGEMLPKDYALFTLKEYFASRNNNMLNSLGKKITDWELPELKSNTLVNPSKLKGNIILLEFWFKNCGGCVMAIPDLNKIKSRFEKDNFKIYGVEFIENYSKDDLKKYIIDQKILYPNLYRGKAIASNYGIRSAPTFMIIDKNGTIIHIKSGFSKENMNEITDIIEKNI